MASKFPQYGVCGKNAPGGWPGRLFIEIGTVWRVVFEPDRIGPICIRETDGLQANILDGWAADQCRTDSMLISDICLDICLMVRLG